MKQKPVPNWGHISWNLSSAKKDEFQDLLLLRFKTLWLEPLHTAKSVWSSFEYSVYSIAFWYPEAGLLKETALQDESPVLKLCKYHK